MSRQPRGFTVIELLVAMTITLIIAGAIASIAQPARAAFDRVPAELELQQRGRTALDVLSQTVRSAGRDVAATASLGPLVDLLPAVSVFDPNDDSSAYGSLSAIVAVVDGAQGVLETNQPAPGGSITLATAPCPNVKDVCGFEPGTTAVIADGLGHFDVFEVALTSPGSRRLTPDGALSRAYPAGAVVAEVDRHTFSLVEQADHSYSLIRETAAGAIQPVVDFVSDLSFTVIGSDSPAGFMQATQVDVSLSIQAPTEALRRFISDRAFKTSIRLRNAK
jgi:prepilin-type N-terminal cleavage/methylation domain-containing protein